MTSRVGFGYQLQFVTRPVLLLLDLEGGGNKAQLVGLINRNFCILDVLKKCLVAMSKPNLPNLARMAEMVKMRLSRRWGRETLKDILVNSRCKHVTMSRVSMFCLVAEVATRFEFQTKRTPVHLPTGASLVGVPINREPWLQICEDH